MCESLDTAASEIDYDRDFTEFVSTTRIVRFDLRDLEFVAFSSTNAAFSGIQAKIALEIAPVYPIGIAHVVADHYPGGTNEIGCRSGKSMLMMEAADEDWCYVMNPVTLVSGFVPSLCLEPIGTALGVVIREETEVENLYLGDCVSILEDQGRNWVVENVFGLSLVVSKGVVGIIY
jgi:hypothetical protein